MKCGTCRKFDVVAGRDHLTNKVKVGLRSVGVDPMKAGLCMKDKSRLTTTESPACESYTPKLKAN